MVSNLDATQVLPHAYDDSKGGLKVVPLAQLVTVAYDYIAVAYPTSTTETYTYKTGGSGGTTVATVTVTYTDATKADISSVART